MKYELSKKTSDVTDLHLTGMQTILDYSDKWVQVYTMVLILKALYMPAVVPELNTKIVHFKKFPNLVERTVPTLMLKL